MFSVAHEDLAWAVDAAISPESARNAYVDLLRSLAAMEEPVEDHGVQSDNMAMAFAIGLGLEIVEPDLAVARIEFGASRATNARS
jgi:hypothetical protein